MLACVFWKAGNKKSELISTGNAVPKKAEMIP